MNDYYFTFGYGQPNHPGYVRVMAPTALMARRLMHDVYGSYWSMQYADFDDIHLNDRVERDVLQYDPAVGGLLQWPCDICKEQRPESHISVARRHVGDNLERNIKYCNDRPDCEAGVDANHQAFMTRITSHRRGAA